MADPGQPARGLTAAELAAACTELRALAGARVVDAVAMRRGQHEQDVVLVLSPGLGAGKVFLQLVVAGPTARVCTTTRRWPADAMLRAALPLVGARLDDVHALPGERIAVLRFLADGDVRQLIAELFGHRGLWVLADGAGRVLRTSRPVLTATRRLAEGDAYAPPAHASQGPAEPPPRFAPPVLAAIDDHFTRLDLLAEARQQAEQALVHARRAAARARARVDGIAGQLADVGRADGLRARANLMLAYQHTVPRGAATMIVPDPEHAGAELRIELDPARPVVVQAQSLYEKARRLDDSRAVNVARLQRAELERGEAERQLAAAEELAAAVGALAATLPDLRERLATLRPPAPAGGTMPAHRPKTGAAVRDPAAGFRRFVSAEGYPILVGRNNEQNDRLTLRVANGNDLWLHVGGGRPGSHVVVRLPKGKTASLETLLDAGTLAVHFSKARGEPRLDVVYTFRKHVRKPKGLPPGAVVPSQTKTITVLRDEGRLRRLLAAGGDGDDDPDGGAARA